MTVDLPICCLFVRIQTENYGYRSQLYWAIPEIVGLNYAGYGGYGAPNPYEYGSPNPYEYGSPNSYEFGSQST